MNVGKRLLAAGVLVLAACSSLSATPIWPLDTEWEPLMVGGSPYVDALNISGAGDVYATTPSPNALDLVGGIDQDGNGPFTTGYWYTDGVDLMFRLRVDDDPTGGKFVWTVFVNIDANDDVDWGLQLDNKTDAQVELAPAISGGPTTANPWDPVVLGGTPHVGVSPLSVWSRFVNATSIDGSHFNKAGPPDDDWFVDMAFPMATFLATTGLSVGDLFTVSLATSADHININKDLPDYTAYSSTIPEPATLVLLLVGATFACVVGVGQRR